MLNLLCVLGKIDGGTVPFCGHDVIFVKQNLGRHKSRVAAFDKNGGAENLGLCNHWAAWQQKR
jgi:hypothetical protein